MLGLALMAAELAAKRTGYGGPHGIATRAALREFGAGRFKFSEEYYRICDRITRGEKP